MFARVTFAIAGALGALLLLLAVQLHVAAQAQPADASDQTQLVINEYMASNSTTLEDPDEPGEYPDWLEIYNPAASPVDMSGLFLIRGEAPDTKVFTVSGSLIVPANGFLLFYADDDPSQGPQHTNFRLNKDLDRIGLYRDAAGTQEIDSRSYSNQVTDYSEGRSVDGGPNWQLFEVPTPGRTNRARPPVISAVTFAPELPKAGAPIQVSATITEEGTVVAATIHYSITGAGLLTVPMTLDQGNRYAGTIPGQPSGAIVSFYVSAQDNDGLVTPDLSVTRPQIRRFPVGYTRPTLVINEIMADNITTLEDPDDPGDFADWIELYNPGPGTVALGGIYLSDDPDNLTKFAISDTLTIAANRYLLFLADEDQEQGPRHTNFKLNKDGESIFLTGAQGTVILDTLKFKDMPSSAAVARIPNASGPLATVTYCPTPGRSNLACAYQVHLPFVTAR